MKKLFLVALSVVLSSCAGMSQSELLKTNPDLELSSEKTVEQYYACIKPSWIGHIGFCFR